MIKKEEAVDGPPSLATVLILQALISASLSYW